MATINRENIGLLNDRISVQVNSEDYLPNFEKALKQYSKGANLPGFRKGMVPAGLIKKMHGQSLFTQEVIRSVEKELNTYLQNEKLSLFGEPLPQNIDEVRVDMNNPDNYQFDFEIGLKPDFELTPLKEGFHFTRYKVKPEEKDIQEEMERLQKKAGERKEKEAVTADDDILNLQFKPSDAEGKTAEEAEAREEQIIVSYFAPGMSGKLTGKKPGDTFVVKLTEAFEQKELDWIIQDWKLDPGSADEQYYLMTLEKVEEIIPKALSEEFYNEVYPGSDIKTEEAFRERIGKDDEAYWANEAGKRLDQDIFEKLVHDTPIELPGDFLKRWLKQEGGNSKSDEEVERQYAQFDHEMRWNLISGKIINDHEITVSPEELQQNFRQRLMGYFGLKAEDGTNEKIEEFAANMMKDEKAVDETYRNLLTQKLFNWLRDQADIEEKEITADEFLKLPHNHHHHEHEH